MEGIILFSLINPWCALQKRIDAQSLKQSTHDQSLKYQPVTFIAHLLDQYM